MIAVCVSTLSITWYLLFKSILFSKIQKHLWRLSRLRHKFFQSFICSVVFFMQPGDLRCSSIMCFLWKRLCLQQHLRAEIHNWSYKYAPVLFCVFLMFQTLPGYTVVWMHRQHFQSSPQAPRYIMIVFVPHTEIEVLKNGLFHYFLLKRISASLIG